MITARVPLIITSALLHTLAFPPWGWAAAAWVALVPFFMALRGVRLRTAILLGWLWGTMAIWGIGFWVPEAFAHYYQQPLWFGLLFALAIALVVGSYSAAFAGCMCWIGPRIAPNARVPAAAALWVVWELARARLLTGEPWILLGYAVVPETRIIQIADLGGVYMLSFLIVFVNAALCATLAACPSGIAPAMRRLVPPAILVAAAYGYGAARLAEVASPSPAVPVTVVQGNNDVGTLWRQEFYGQGLAAYLKDSYDAAADQQPALIVWPENAITFFLADEPRFRRGIARMVATTGAELILGGPHREGADESSARYFNSAFLVGADGELRGRYDKTHLLPFAEYFPLRTIELLRRRFERVRSFTPGEAVTPLATRLGPIATVICFEAIFPELVRRQTTAGATVLVNLSNDAWLGRGAGPAQHLAMVALRAVENRVWVIRAATTGISALIDPHGRIVARTETFTPAVLSGMITPQSVDTLYKRAGDWFAYACLAASGVGILWLSPIRSAAVARSVPLTGKSLPRLDRSRVPELSMRRTFPCCSPRFRRRS